MGIRRNYSKSQVVTLSLSLVLTSFVALSSYFWNQARKAIPAPKQQADKATQARVSEAYGKLPLTFEINQGQTDSQVKFLSRGSGYTLFLTPTEAVLNLSKSSVKKKNKFNPSQSTDAAMQTEKAESNVMRMNLVGANPSPEIKGLGELSGKSNYFIGNNPEKWRTNVSHYTKVKYEDVYSGVDVVYYGNQGLLEYDFVIAPGVDPNIVTLNFEADKIEVDSYGNLVIQIGDTQIKQHKPVIYQEIVGIRQEISGSYILKGNKRVGFNVSNYDVNRPLVIDPVLAYSTYLGGTESDYGSSIAVDAAGNAYVTGLSASLDFPTQNALQSNNAGRRDIFVAKLNPTGAFVFSTYLGGSDSDFFGSDFEPNIAVDPTGIIYIAGATTSPDYPVFNAAQPTIGGRINNCDFRSFCHDAFVTKLNSSGSSLIYSTYLGGEEADFSTGVAVDAYGNAHLTGLTNSADFPLVNALFAIHQKFDAFVTKLNPVGSIVYSTYLGGSGDEDRSRIASDPSGNAYVTGFTYSSDFPTTPNSYQPVGNNSGFVAKLNASGSALVYSTYISGTALMTDITVDGSGNALVTGRSFGGLPIINAFQPMHGGTFFTGGRPAGDGFILKLNATGSALVYSTYIGGSHDDTCHSIAVDTSGAAYVTGATVSSNFPTLNPIQPTLRYIDAFITKIDATGSLVYSTYFGGNGADSGEGIAVGSDGSVYVIGGTDSTDLPTLNPIQPSYGGGNIDAFVVKIADAPPNQPPTISGQSITRQRGDDGTVSTIALVGDDLTPTGSLTIALGTVPSGITVSNLTNNNGTITATVAANCSAALGNNFVPIQVTDGSSLTAVGALTINVTDNPTPIVAITSPPSGTVYQIGSTVNFAGSFTDNVGDIHTAQWSFSSINNSFSQAGTVDENNRTVSTSYTFNSSGVYLVSLSLTDECGNVVTANTINNDLQAMVVVYDPNGGFVTGGGWINSPAGAYRADVTLTGKASFGFVSKYQHGANVPTGNTEFQFRAANFNFRSISYDWLLIAGARAQYKGSGTINGSGDYGFMLTAIDGRVNGGGGVDKFRIKIWNRSTGGVIYDNQVSGDTGDNATPNTALGGGSIVIHRP